MTPRSLTGLSVAVTGGGHGIGAATSRAFAQAGARVAIGDLEAGAGRATAAAIGPDVAGFALDVRDSTGFALFLDAAEAAHGALDVLVNNAGVDWVGPFEKEPGEVTRQEVDTNLLGTVRGTRLALARMLPRRRGRVVNVASGVGRVPLPGSAVYAATKHAIVGLTESLRLEYRRSGVRFSLVLPSQVHTAMIAGQPLPRLLPVVTPDAVAAAVVHAARTGRFEVWVPASQGVSVKLGSLLPRPAREAALRAVGVGRIAGEADLVARCGYHERTFGRS